MRSVVNKKLSSEEIAAAARHAKQGGLSALKLYGMVGLPSEEEEDVDIPADTTAPEVASTPLPPAPPTPLPTHEGIHVAPTHKPATPPPTPKPATEAPLFPTGGPEAVTTAAPSFPPWSPERPEIIDLTAGPTTARTSDFLGLYLTRGKRTAFLEVHQQRDLLELQLMIVG